MINKKIIVALIFLAFIVGVLLTVVYGLITQEPLKDGSEYEQKLQEQNQELTLLEQIGKLDTFKEKCVEVRADPNSYYPEVVDMCKLDKFK